MLDAVENCAIYPFPFHEHHCGMDVADNMNGRAKADER